MRKFIRINIADPELFSKKLLILEKEFSNIAILDSNGHPDFCSSQSIGNSYETIAAIGSLDELSSLNGKWIAPLENYLTGSRDWLFGHLGYDLKNEIESLTSSNPDRIKFAMAGFFRPRYIFTIRNKILEAGWNTDYNHEHEVRRLVKNIDSGPLPGLNEESCICKVDEIISRAEYLKTVEKIKDHIKRGDIYEANFCQEFYSENANIDPSSIWLRLIKESPAPFSCFYKRDDKYLLCASPERFMKKTGNRIISQPIKGTAKRGKTGTDDRDLSDLLASDPKERAENIMITDLVRNDLSRIAERASVKVDELCNVYPYPGVFQMQSSISARLPVKTGIDDIIKAMFPMGSMTGVPKIRAMEIIEQYEKTRRGLYSGAVGYITPDTDFDFNVVIRSIQYDRVTSNLSFMVGGAITGMSVAVKEYEECLLKAGAILRVLGGGI